MIDRKRDEEKIRKSSKSKKQDENKYTQSIDRLFKISMFDFLNSFSSFIFDIYIL